MAKVVDLGAVGYYQQQVTPTAAHRASSRNRVAAVGPEVSVAFPKQMFFVSLRYNYEFMAENPRARQRRHADAHEAVLGRVRKPFPCHAKGRPEPALFADTDH